jgi:hypothetical protein
MDHSPPIRSKRGHLKVATYPTLRSRRRSYKQRSEMGYSETSRPICRVSKLSFWHNVRSALLERMRGGDFSL